MKLTKTRRRMPNHCKGCCRRGLLRFARISVSNGAAKFSVSNEVLHQWWVWDCFFTTFLSTRFLFICRNTTFSPKNGSFCLDGIFTSVNMLQLHTIYMQPEEATIIEMEPVISTISLSSMSPLAARQSQPRAKWKSTCLRIHICRWWSSTELQRWFT